MTERKHSVPKSYSSDQLKRFQSQFGHLVPELENPKYLLVDHEIGHEESPFPSFNFREKGARKPFFVASVDYVVLDQKSAARRETIFIQEDGSIDRRELEYRNPHRIQTLTGEYAAGNLLGFHVGFYPKEYPSKDQLGAAYFSEGRLLSVRFSQKEIDYGKVEKEYRAQQSNRPLNISGGFFTEDKKVAVPHIEFVFIKDHILSIYANAWQDVTVLLGKVHEGIPFSHPITDPYTFVVERQEDQKLHIKRKSSTSFEECIVSEQLDFGKLQEQLRAPQWYRLVQQPPIEFIAKTE